MKNKDLLLFINDNLIKENGTFNSTKVTVKFLEKNFPEFLSKLEELTSFLDLKYKRVKVTQRIWHLKNDWFSCVTCPVCYTVLPWKKTYSTFCSKRCENTNKGKQILNEKRINTNLERYGVDHPSKLNEFDLKRRETCMEKYGVENFTETENFVEISKLSKQEKYGNSNYTNREKYIKTCIERYGVENSFQCEEIKFKIKQTNLSKYGVKHPLMLEIFKNKRRQTCVEKFEVEHASQCKEVMQKIIDTNNKRYDVDYVFQYKKHKEKYIQTCLSRYGVKHPSQTPNLMQNVFNGFKNCWHDYQLPSGNWIKLQGYEPKCLDLLLNEYLENEIYHRKKDMPEIWYRWEDNTWHRYFPDFYIPKDNLVIEVKSNYTYKVELEKNLLKEEATKYLGYNFKLYIITEKELFGE